LDMGIKSDMSKGIQRKTFDPSLMHDLARYIEARSDEVLSLEMLAGQAHLSPSHLQRCFKEVMGVSPKVYHEACRLRRFKGELRVAGSVSEAIYELGFSSPSRIYEKLERNIGMTPGAYRAGGERQEISYVSVETILGLMMIAATDRGICYLQFGDGEVGLLADLEREFPKAEIYPMGVDIGGQFGMWVAELNRYLGGEGVLPELPLDIRGTVFQVQVWQFLRMIPAGGTLSYAEVAAGIGRAGASRAVAGACARNRVAILVPCHRVIRANGGLAGYRRGVSRKRLLLELEGVELDGERIRPGGGVCL